MKLKQRASDFRVRELLRDGVLIGRGEFRVYRVIKRKLTSMEAAEVLADEAGRGAGEVSMCGLKDRQGVTTQYMALERGPEVRISGPDLRIETVGFAADALDSKDSDGNAFEIVARGLTQDDISALRANLAGVRKQGLINYFDDQRFGNLRHGQGWIARDLMRGEFDHALKTLIAAHSLHDVPRNKTLKQALWDSWGDWTACREIAGKLGQHHSVFEFLKKNPEDIAGAFYHVSSRVRLIHLYAFQSHIWNRAVADYVREHVQPADRVVLDCEEGPLVYPDDSSKLPATPDATFRLPGPRLEDVTDAHQRALLNGVLASERLTPDEFNIEHISGFQLKGEDRPLFVKAAHLRVRPPKDDPLHRGFAMLGVRFELPRGAYATLVMRRLLELPGREHKPAPAWDREGSETVDEGSPRRDDAGPRSGPGAPVRSDRGDDRGDYRRDDRGGDRSYGARDERAAPHYGGSRFGAGSSRDQRGGQRFDRGGPRYGGPPRDDRSPPRDDSGAPRDERLAPRGGDSPTRDDRGGRGFDRGGRGYGRGYGGGAREDRGAPRYDRPAPHQGDYPTRDDRGGRGYGGGGRGHGGAPRYDRGAPRDERPAPRGGDSPTRDDRGGRGFDRGGRGYGGGAARDDRGGPRDGGGARDNRGGSYGDRPRYGDGGPRYGDGGRDNRGGSYGDRPRYGDRAPRRDSSGPRHGDRAPGFDSPAGGGSSDAPRENRDAPRDEGTSSQSEHGRTERPQRKRFDPNWRAARDSGPRKSDGEGNSAPGSDGGERPDSGVNPASGREESSERSFESGEAE